MAAPPSAPASSGTLCPIVPVEVGPFVWIPFEPPSSLSICTLQTVVQTFSLAKPGLSPCCILSQISDLPLGIVVCFLCRVEVFDFFNCLRSTASRNWAVVHDPLVSTDDEGVVLRDGQIIPHSRARHHRDANHHTQAAIQPPHVLARREILRVDPAPLSCQERMLAGRVQRDLSNFKTSLNMFM